MLAVAALGSTEHKHCFREQSVPRLKPMRKDNAPRVDDTTRIRKHIHQEQGAIKIGHSTMKIFFLTTTNTSTLLKPLQML